MFVLPYPIMNFNLHLACKLDEVPLNGLKNLNVLPNTALKLFLGCSSKLALAGIIYYTK
jgi:hypothetical protein